MARCEVTDLEEQSCAHCLKQPDPEREERRELAALLQRPGWRAAQYRNQCSVCQEWHSPGYPIHIDRDERRWIGGCCRDTLST